MFCIFLDETLHVQYDLAYWWSINRVERSVHVPSIRYLPELHHANHNFRTTLHVLKYQLLAADSSRPHSCRSGHLQHALAIPTRAIVIIKCHCYLNYYLDEVEARWSRPGLSRKYNVIISTTIKLFFALPV